MNRSFTTVEGAGRYYVNGDAALYSIYSIDYRVYIQYTVYTYKLITTIH